MYLFVYGTLKKGKCNHRMMSSAKFLSEAYITGYQLHQAPAITPKEGSIVYGEVYEVNEALLESLDSFEGHNEQSPQHSLYRRTDMTCKFNDYDMSPTDPAHGGKIWDVPVGVYVYNRPINVPVNPTGVY